MLIKSNTRKDLVRRQKNIIDHVSKKSESHHGSSPSMREAFYDYGKNAKKMGFKGNTKFPKVM